MRALLTFMVTALAISSAQATECALTIQDGDQLKTVALNKYGSDLSGDNTFFGLEVDGLKINANTLTDRKAFRVAFTDLKAGREGMTGSDSIVPFVLDLHQGSQSGKTYVDYDGKSYEVSCNK